MHSINSLVAKAAVLAALLTSVQGAAYGLGVTTNQAQFGDGAGAGPIITDTTMALCFSDTTGACGNCGISWKDGYTQSTDITNPGKFKNDKCGDPCVTYDSKGVSQDDLRKASPGTAAGTLLVASSGATLNCKTVQNTDCGGVGLAGANYNSMLVECDPSY